MQSAYCKGSRCKNPPGEKGNTSPLFLRGEWGLHHSGVPGGNHWSKIKSSDQRLPGGLSRLSVPCRSSHRRLSIDPDTGRGEKCIGPGTIRAGEENSKMDDLAMGSFTALGEDCVSLFLS